MRKKSRRQRRKNKRIIIAIIFFLIAIISLGIYLFYRYGVRHQPKSQPDQVDKITEQEIDPKIEELKTLYQENNDLVGWIKIDNTKIDYPIMYTKDEDYYLYKDFYKNYSKPGSIYIDKHNTVETRDINLIIHGHSMKDGSMFRELINYENKEFYNQHKTITIYTLTEKQEYEIIAVFLSKVYNKTDNVFKYYQFYGPQTEESYNNYIQNIKKLSLYNIDITAQYPEELITLSTCEYSQENGRIAIVAKKV